MFGRKKRERERGRKLAIEAFPFLETVLEYQLAVTAGTTLADPARFGVVPIIERLLAICGEDPNAVMTVLETWWERYEESDDERSTVASAIYLAVGLNGLGNLFGAIPPETPAFDPGLAAEGRARGWRS